MAMVEWRATYRFLADLHDCRVEAKTCTFCRKSSHFRAWCGPKSSSRSIKAAWKGHWALRIHNGTSFEGRCLARWGLPAGVQCFLSCTGDDGWRKTFYELFEKVKQNPQSRFWQNAWKSLRKNRKHRAVLSKDDSNNGSERTYLGFACSWSVGAETAKERRKVSARWCLWLL